MIAQRGKEAGFDLHRLLAWAKDQGKQHELQMALFNAHFTQNLALNENDNLLNVVSSLGLDIATAKSVLDSDAYAEQVRAEQTVSLENGIHSVPTFIINNKHSISVGQSAETFKQVLTQIAQEG